MLFKLFKSAELHNAGARQRIPSLTVSKLKSYRGVTSLAKKESFEATLKAARAIGAVELIWDNAKSGGDFIARVNLVNRRALAEFLGVVPNEVMHAAASEQLRFHRVKYPVVDKVLARWEQLRTVRATGPSDWHDWLDAIRVIDLSRTHWGASAADRPLREASAEWFNDSKRIEKLIGPIDVLLQDDLDAAPRDANQVLQELGLFREVQPARLAGRVVIRRERVTALLDSPYTALAPDTVLGIDSLPDSVMTIENQTTFHSEARRRHQAPVLLIYTGGMPSPAWRAMYIRLLSELPEGCCIYHWGDVDEGGFRIASTLSQDARQCGHTIQPWRMAPQDVPLARQRPASQHTRTRIAHFAHLAGWTELGKAVAEAGFTAEQEALA